ncbi:uncharacterized protein OCT59_025193 [Rhizophagus irregularis]|uniref:uncharacterized protein n=1 Tax=Rhizophagus irregularis TaxID=588596 RepID=UPI000CC63E9A|nr:hypothetical protein OCT59_025193 [Rhizophagus irregularis]CAB5187078.1 unnamed protein product [Rhizophagus irregularis]
MTVNIKETYNVRPTQPTQHSPIILSNHDLVLPMVYMFAHHFYKNVDNKNDFMDPSKLRDSLGDILSDYYPLAGRLKKEIDGKLSIACCDQGIPFIIAKSPDITIQQLEEKKWQPSSIPDHLVPDLPVTHGLISLPLDVPLLMVQHTTLADGSVVLGTVMHHTIADGISLFCFLDNWGRKARQEPIIPPVHDRSLLKASGNPPTHEHPEFKLFKLPTEASQAMPPMPPMITKLFHINRDNLKKLCNVYSGEHNLVSANDALVAHLWRLVTRARGIPLDAEVICAFPCDGRKRLKPFFPPNYFGNCILNTVLKMLVSELINGSQPNLALQIRKAIDKVNDSKIRSSIDWIEQQPNKSEIKLNCNYYCGKDLVLTNWSKFSLYDLDFGYGTPLRFSLRRGRNLDGIVILLGTKYDDGIQAYTSLIIEHMQKLEQDPEFKEFFQIS